ncbi:Transposase (plasmid) [Borrelia hermsii YBT]|uniref:Transposase n=1 Tax=Borrelia hermsii YBT TaxID=1313295 RepID=W5T805_BORHE|nr:hypothetical protein [Borrelia hermsii]AHH13461.1 Transposase [Borrelia hermsii YBT]
MRNNFFRAKGKGNKAQGFSKYKSKKDEQTYITNSQKGSVRIKNGKIIGFGKITMHRRLGDIEVIKNVTIEKDTDNRCYLHSI